MDTELYCERQFKKGFIYRPISSYSKQGSGNIKYYFGKSSNNLGLRFTYSKDYLNNKTYSFGPELELNFNLTSNTTIRTTLTVYKTDRDYQAKLNFFFNFNNKYVQIYNNSSYNINKERFAPKDFEDHFDSSTALTLQNGSVSNQDLRFTARYDDINAIQTKGLELDYKSGIGRLTVSASTNQNINEYSLNFASIFAFNKDHILFGGREPKQSAIAIEIEGKNKESVFDIYVDQNKTDFIKGDSTRILPLNPFNQYQISLQAQGVNNLILDDNKLRLITLYQGSVQTIKYKAKATIVIIGTLYSQNGKILTDTTIKGKLDETTTDEDGYFQITAVLGETLQINDNMQFEVDKNINKNDKNIVFIKKVTAQNTK